MPSPSSQDSEIMVAAGAVLVDEQNRVLLVQHVEAKKGGFWYGKWICPGGKLKPGEGMQEGVAREVKEETGLDLTLSRGPIVFERIVKEGSKPVLHVIYIDYVAKVAGGTLRAGSDVGLARWFSRRELDQRWAELHEDTQRLLKESGILAKENSILV
jgi:8-oxo-dGTP diphosphatase